MKKTELINAPMSRVVAQLGHTDRLCVADAGLPIPDGVERIDLAIRTGLPSFLDVFRALTSEMFVERAILASELQQFQPGFHTTIIAALTGLQEQQGNIIQIDYVQHEAFKSESHSCKAVIRTGEITPYANIILCSGVTFT